MDEAPSCERTYSRFARPLGLRSFLGLIGSHRHTSRWMVDRNLPRRADIFDEERELRLLVARLPKRLGRAVTWLRQPVGKRVRIPAGLLFIVGGLLGFLPVLGFWMLPIGLALLADDIPALRNLRSRLLLAYSQRRGRLDSEARSSGTQRSSRGRD